MAKYERKQFQSDEEKLLIAKVEDKIKFCKSKSKIVNTDFLKISEISLIKKFLIEKRISNYFFFGGQEDADRNILIFYPEEKLTQEMVLDNINLIVNAIKIELPKELIYEHREFLSGIMKLGIKREKFGDILINGNIAYVIVLAELAEYLREELKNLTRFRKAKIDIVNIEPIEEIQKKFEEFTIIVSSMRLDNFVAELARCSRSQAESIIKEQRVFLNSVLQEKVAKKIVEGDIITIRGKGKFIYLGIERKTKSGNSLVKIKKYV